MDILVVSCLTVLVLILVVYAFSSNGSSSSGKPKSIKKDSTKPKEVRLFTKEEVANHNTLEDCWLIINNKVYDVTEYVDEHVGGDAIGKLAGLDNTKGFLGPQHPEKVTQMIEEYYIGDLVD